jgi:hypothetical protein
MAVLTRTSTTFNPDLRTLDETFNLKVNGTIWLFSLFRETSPAIVVTESDGYLMHTHLKNEFQFTNHLR